jgi:uncharacterized membrane protein YphA (DoxX/SURF4 family)
MTTLTRNLLRALAYGNGITAFLRVLLGLLFAYSGVVKMLDPVGFGKIVGMYGILPGELLPYAAVTIPSIELLAGALLAAGYRIKPAALITSSLLVIFIAAIAYGYVRGGRFDCGCFGLARFGIGETIGPAVMARDVVLLAVSVVLFRAKKHVASIEAVAERIRLREL